MTGDGVNDILVLKDADCGIAMASGSEAVSQVAEVVLMMIRTLPECRRLFPRAEGCKQYSALGESVPC